MPNPTDYCARATDAWSDPSNGRSGRQTPENTGTLAGLQRRGGSLSAHPYLFTSEAAWAALDFCVAFYCATLIDIGKRGTVGLMHSVQAGGNVHLPSIAVGLLFGLCITTLSRLSGLHFFHERRGWLAELVRIVQVVAVAGFGLYGASHFWRVQTLTRAVLPEDCIVVCMALFFSRLLWRRHSHVLRQRGVAARNVLVVGVDSIGREVRDHLVSLRFAGYRFKGFVTLGEATDDASQVPGDQVVGDVRSVIQLARSMFADEIIFTRRPATPDVLANVVHQARANGIDLRLVPSLSETLNNRADVQYLGNLPTIVIYQRKHRALSMLAKRAIDMVFASAALLVFSPLMFLITLAIKLQSPGPVLYVSKRVGYKGNVFNCYKFRSMVADAEAMKERVAHLNERKKILFKITKDPRLTAVGAVLRKYSLDELPQLWNVLRGDMSLVGPRPSIGSEVDQYQTAHLRRLDVIPGITGLWQVEARQDPSFESYIELDSKYVNDWSIWLDFKILLRTVSAIITGTGV